MKRRCLIVVLSSLFLPVLQAASVRNHVFSRALPPPDAGCAGPIATDFFQNTDDNLNYWFMLSGMNTGDAIAVSWTTSAGQFDSSSKFSPLKSGGSYCFYEQIPLKTNPARAVSGRWTFTVTVNGSSILRDSVLVVGPGMPQIDRTGVRNSASFTTDAGRIAPGTLVSITGSNLAPNSLYAQGTPLPLSLGGVSVTFNGSPVGIFYVSAGEIDVQAPWSINSDTAFVQVNNNGTVTNTIRAPIAPASPGIFTDTSVSAAAALVYRFPADGSDPSRVSPANPLQRGDVAAFLGTGFGPFSDPPADFSAGNSDSLSLLPIGVSFGGTRSSGPVGVLDTANDPVDVGVNYVFATVPNEVPNGPAVPVTINVAGIGANQVTVPIGGTPPAPAPLQLTSITHYPPGVDSSASFNPGATMSLNASAIVQNVKTYAHLYDGNGYDAMMPVVEVQPGQAIVSVPPYIDQSKHQVTNGTVTCTLIQVVGGQIVTSNPVSLQIAPMFTANSATGHLTAEFLSSISEGARSIDSAYIYKQLMTGGAYSAPSANLNQQAVTGGLRDLVGGTIEVSVGSASSVDLGTINGNDVTFTNNQISLFDAMLSAVLKENRKALPLLPGQTAAARPYQTAAFGPRLPGSPEDSRDSIVGLLGTYFGQVVACNSPFQKIEDEVSSQNSNCPTPRQALDNVIVAAGSSLVEAVNGVAEDAKRLKGFMGAAAILLMGEVEAPVIIAKLATDAALARAVGGLAGNMISSAAAPSDARDEAMREGRKAIVDGLTDAFSDKLDDAIAGQLKPLDDSLEKAYKGINTEMDAAEVLGMDQRPTILQATNDLIAESQSFAANLIGPRNTANGDGSNGEDDSVPNDPGIEITGTVDDGSGHPLKNVTVELTNGDDSVTPYAVSDTLTDGSYDLIVPRNANIPSTVQFEIGTMDESGDVITFNGPQVNLNQGSQHLNTQSISYDSDDDGDDDSDGSDAIPPATRVLKVKGPSPHATPHPVRQTRVAGTRPKPAPVKLEPRVFRHAPPAIDRNRLPRP